MSSKKGVLVVGSVALAIGAVATAIFKLISNGKTNNLSSEKNYLSNEEIEEFLANSLKKNPNKKKKGQVKKLIEILIAQEKEGKEEAKDSLNFIQEEGSDWAKKLVKIYRKKH